jgi:protoheme IX farnesyltransferase
MEIVGTRHAPLRRPSAAERRSIAIVQLPTRHTRFVEFFALMKPRVTLLAVFTAFVGMLVAPARPYLLPGSAAIVAIAMGAGAAGVLNMWYDADIDRVMCRTAMRPIARGAISRAEALVFGLVLAIGSVASLAFVANLMAAGLLGFAIFFYVVVYTVWLKRRTPQNIVIGGAAGALPPAIGWAAGTGGIGLEPVILFLIVFLWTPFHFWALALNRSDEYARAGIPMLPVVAGRTATTRRILIYSVLLLPTSVLPTIFGFAGPIYGVTAAACGAISVSLAWRLHQSAATDRQAANRVFAYSIFYLFVLFAALLANSSIRSPLLLGMRVTPTATASAVAGFVPHTADAAARNGNNASADEG